MTVTISKMTNAMVEAISVSASLVFGLFGAPIWVLVAMMGVGLGWWIFTHLERFVARWNRSAARSVGLMTVVLLAIACAHFSAFGFGRVLRSILGFT